MLTTASCGYSFPIAQSQSGEVCSDPFNQDELNTRLLAMLEGLDMASWSKNGLVYGEKDELYALPEAVADILEELFLPEDGSG